MGFAHRHLPRRRGAGPAMKPGPSRSSFSVVVPVFNDGCIVPKLYERLLPVLSNLCATYEIILVDDGSTDDTMAHLLRLHQRDPAVKIIRFTRNFGHQAAISAGLQRAAGDYVAVMDDDLQDPPESLPILCARLDEGYDVAYAIRTNRPEGFLKRTAYHLFYRLFRFMAAVDVPLDAGDFCVMRRTVVLALNCLPERQRFVRGLRSWVGFRQVGVPTPRSARAGGVSNYTWWKLTDLCLDGVVSFSIMPLRVASYLGFLISAVSFLGVGVVFYFRLFTDRTVPGFAALATLILFLGGIQLLTIGIAGEYIGRIFDAVKQRPSYITGELVGWAEPAEDAVNVPDTPGSY